MKKRLIAAVAMLLLAGAAGYWLWTHPELLGRPRATAEEAAEIKAAIERWFVERSEIEPWRIDLSPEGQVTVEPDGAGYRITVPPVSMEWTDGTGTHGKFGQVEARIERQGDGNWGVTWTAGPVEVSVLRPEEVWEPPGPVEVGTVTLAGGEGGGTFEARYGWLSRYAMKVGPIVFTPADPEQGPTVTLSGMTLGVDSAEPEPGMLDAKAEVALTDIKATILGALPVGSIGELKLTASLRKLDLAAFTSWTEAISRARQRFKATDGDRDRDAERREVTDILLTSLRLLDGAGIRYEVSDVNVPMTATSLDSALFGLELMDVRSDAPDLRLALNMSGFKSRTTLFGIFDNLLAAKDLHIDIGLVDLPKARLIQNHRMTAELDWHFEPVDMLPVVLDFNDLIMNGGAYLDVASVRFGSDIYAVDLTGEVRPEPSSPLSATATFALAIEGFDAVIEGLRNPQKPGDEFDFETMFSLELADWLAEMQALGAETVGEDGRKSWRYDFLAAPDGAITLNGKDAKPLLGIP